MKPDTLYLFKLRLRTNININYFYKTKGHSNNHMYMSNAPYFLGLLYIVGYLFNAQPRLLI